MNGGGTRANEVWIAPGATSFSCLCERCLDARDDAGSFLEAVRVAVVRGSIDLDADMAVGRCAAGHRLIVRRGKRPPTLAPRDSRQLQIA
jgi:hypothetical protein